MHHDDEAEPTGWFDRRVRDRNGEVFGVVVDVYVDATTRQPSWLAINSGLFGTRVTVAPVQGASLLGEDVVVVHSKHTVASAPAFTGSRTLDPAAEQAIARHYAQQRSTT